MVVNVTNEIVVLKQASKENLKHIIQQEKLFLGPNHVALQVKKYDMDLRIYLE